MSATPLERARSALDRARSRPRKAIALAAGALTDATTSEERATAHFAIGMANRSLFSGAASTTHLEQAAEAAGEAGDGTLLGRILRSLAFNYAQDGRHIEADETIGRSLSMLTGAEHDISLLQQAFILMMRGDHQAALPVLDDAIVAFEQTGDDDSLGLTLYNRAVIFMEFGDFGAAIADLERAYEIASSHGEHVSAAEAALHMSEVLGWKDDVPAAIQWHTRSVEHRVAAGAQNPQADTEHAFVLIQARLLQEAEQVLRGAIPALVAAGGNDAAATQAHLLLADVLRRRGAHRDAAAQVRLAAGATPPDGRFRFDVAAAEHQVRIASGETSRALLESITSTATDMEANGERLAAAAERLTGVDVALALGDSSVATDLCTAAGRVARSCPLWLQIHICTARAKCRLATGNYRGAAAAVRAGMSRLNEYRRGIGAPDLRIRAAGYGIELTAIGTKLAIRSAAPRRVYEWAERTRAAGGAAPRTAPQQPEVGETLAQLRRVTSRLRVAAPEQRRPLLHEQRRLERIVRDLAHQATGAASSTPGEPSLDRLQAALDGRALIHYLVDGDTLHALVATEHHAQLCRLGPYGEIHRALDHLGLAARRIARPATSEASRSAAVAVADEVGDLLRRLLIDPVRDSSGGRRLVVVPAGPLHGVPWNLIAPGPVEVSPSAAVWLQARRRPRGGHRGVVASGPDLVHGVAEAAVIARITGAHRTSTIDETLLEMTSAHLAHFACHARPRGDSPMFSSLVLDDGELTIYDIEQAAAAPEVVVLAACDAGSAVLHQGEETLGLAAAFLAAGARTVIAPLFTVSDAATARVMRELHTLLGAGEDPATALVSVARISDALAAFTARTFACFGAAEAMPEHDLVRGP